VEIILAYLEGSYLVLSSIGLFMLSLLAFYFWKKKQNLSFENQALSKELARLTEKIQSQELINLEYKLNPHLFKNILNSIQSHAYQTYFALDKMSNVLDYLLYDSRNKFVSAKEEVQFAMDLIEINKIKLSQCCPK
jgi:LytS/YehU family sensor histidine kinase